MNLKKIKIYISKSGERIIDAEKLSLENWLQLLKFRPEEETSFIDYKFPTLQHKKEYFEKINFRENEEIQMLLRNFLWYATTFGSDESNIEKVHRIIKIRKRSEMLEIEHRFLMWHATNGRIPIWDGTRWVLDLLPYSPRICIDVLTAIYSVYYLKLPDGRLDGLVDAMDLIRAKYINVLRKGDEFDSIDCREMEKLISVLYKAMRYEVQLTPRTCDGGYDVIIFSKKAGRREKTVIEVKHHKSRIGVGIVRQLMGVVSDLKANKGILITSSAFTKGAINMGSKNPRLELIDGNALLHLLNEYLGTDWQNRLYSLIMQFDKKQMNFQKDKINEFEI
jgi:restriction system protein